MSRPWRRMCPSVGSSKPGDHAQGRRLPRPGRPSMLKNSPSAMSRSMPSTATTSPKRFTTPSSLTAGTALGSVGVAPIAGFDSTATAPRASNGLPRRPVGAWNGPFGTARTMRFAALGCQAPITRIPPRVDGNDGIRVPVRAADTGSGEFAAAALESRTPSRCPPRGADATLRNRRRRPLRALVRRRRLRRRRCRAPRRCAHRGCRRARDRSRRAAHRRCSCSARRSRISTRILLGLAAGVAGAVGLAALYRGMSLGSMGHRHRP